MSATLHMCAYCRHLPDDVVCPGRGRSRIPDIAHDGKADTGKAPWHLLPWSAVASVVDVLAYGAAKYAPNAWQSVPGGRDRYFAAAQRHLVAWFEGERVDRESGLPHLAHVACNVLFLYALEDRT